MPAAARLRATHGGHSACPTSAAARWQAFQAGAGPRRHRAARAPTDEALHSVLHKIITRTMKLLTRRGVLVEEEGSTYVADSDGDSDEARTLRPLQAAACTYRIAFGPRAGQKVLTVQGAMPRDGDFKQTLCADIDGFSLHAAVRSGADDRQALEQLCRYITRPALANERVQTNAAGLVVLKLKTAWRDGTTHLVMSPLEFMQRLAALVPCKGLDDFDPHRSCCASQAR
ncbi:MAG: transposase [Rubrivivax sp.]|nr:transposase [Rubrivivax sp.]